MGSKKRCNIYVTGVPEGEEKKQGDIMTENFPNIAKHINRPRDLGC